MIFIDFDGVLLPVRAAFLPGQDLHSPRFKAGDDAPEDCVEDRIGRQWFPFRRKLDPSAVSLLKRLVERRGAYLVASTSWKDHLVGGKQVIEDALIEAGFDPQPHWHEDWCTPPPGDLGRPDEIAKWLQRYEYPERWVAIDDVEKLWARRSHCARADRPGHRRVLPRADAARCFRSADGAQRLADVGARHSRRSRLARLRLRRAREATGCGAARRTGRRPSGSGCIEKPASTSPPRCRMS